MNEEYGNIPDGFLLNPEEVEELRKQKHEITEYGKEKLRKLMIDPTLDEMLEIAAERESANQQPFYRYRVIDYFGTGEGRTIFLQISRNNSPSYPEDHFQKRWEKFVDVEFYLQGTEELTEEEFMKRYSRHIPERISILIEEKALSIWQNHYHFNYC
jgi:hypothetical protein